MVNQDQGGPIGTIIASAGTGKTTAIVAAIADAIAGGVAPDRILGTTFTIKAAAELVERTRARLIGNGRSEEATALLNARMGTVNGVCGRIVGEFSLELGRSPSTEVIEEGASAKVFAIAADAVIARYAPAMIGYAAKFGFDAGGERKRVDWRKTVRAVVDMARCNGIDAAGLRDSAVRSKLGISEILAAPVAGDTAESLDRDLADSLAAAASQLLAGSVMKSSEKAKALVLQLAAAVARGETLSWPEWGSLAKCKSTKADDAVFDPVRAAASAHARHPRLLADLSGYVDAVFACAADSLDAFQAFKASRGLLDFTDQETLALEVLRRPDLRGRLAERIGAVFVDEVQDSSPIQIALFTELSRIAGASTWVGDPKQSIYGFRGADARLTVAACAIAARDGSPPRVLSKSWRSRPGIVDFVNAAFVPAFVAAGMEAESARFSECACDDAGLGVPALTLWRLDGGKAEEVSASLASALAQAVADPASWPVRERAAGEATVRGLRPGDVAVLCRSNDDVKRVAAHLAAAGLRVAVERQGLLRRPEIELAVAALRWTADAGDRLSLAEMARLLGGDSDAWLQASLSAESDADLKALVPFAADLDALRRAQIGKTPSETLDAIIVATGILDSACAWGDPGERVDDLEALRGLVAGYEDTCRRLRASATLNGLAIWLEGQSAPRPPCRDPDAVTVMTYHGSKGLEWPVTILTELADPPRVDCFRPAVEIDGDIDWGDPLSGRWIRFWPWPYGAQRTDLHIDATALASGAGQALARAADEEAVRLLYVGATRARDHLVFACEEKKHPVWLDLLTGAGAPIAFPKAEGPGALTVFGTSHPIRVSAHAGSASSGAVSPVQAFVAPAAAKPPSVPFWIRPSDAEAPVPGMGPVTGLSIGDRMPFSGDVEMDVLGEALHAVFAADDRAASPAGRLDRAAGILARWGVAAVRPEDVLTACDNLWSHLDGAYPGATIRREVPVIARRGGRMVRGRIDLLIDGDGWFAILDHKSFPGGRDLWMAKAEGHAGQLGDYAEAVATATGKRCARIIVHMPVVGRIASAEIA